MRNKEQAARSVLGLRNCEVDQASRELVELLAALPENHPLFETFAAHPKIGPAWQKCREKLRHKSAAFRAWQDSLTKGPW